MSTTANENYYANLTYTRRIMGGTKPNARTQAIAQRTPLGGLYRTYANGHGPNRKHKTVRHNYGHRTGATLDTKQCHTRAAALQYLANQIHKLRPLSLMSQETYNYPSHTTICNNTASIY